MYVCAHTKWSVYSVSGKRVFTFFLAVSFDSTILLLTNRVMAFEQNCILDLYQCGIRICP